jgi:ssDNA-binding Zn-finger/Zn-ribbon topoisomerase 1
MLVKQIENKKGATTVQLKCPKCKKTILKYRSGRRELRIYCPDECPHLRVEYWTYERAAKNADECIAQYKKAHFVITIPTNDTRFIMVLPK